MAAVPIIRFGSEQQVNTYVTSTQEAPSVTTLGDGGWLVTWQSLGQDGSGYGIYQQRYDASGNTVGGETKVNTTTFSFQFLPRVTALKDGGWLVTWQSMGQDSSGYGVYQQRYDADGNSIGGETQVNTYVAGSQSLPRVTALANGGWLVTWQSQGQDSSGSGIYQQRYDADGSAVGNETRVNTTTHLSQLNSSVTALANGGWVVTWHTDSQDGDGFGIYQQRYDANGNPVGAEAKVNTHTASNQDTPDVTAMADGGWVATWQSDNQDGSSYGIYQQRYDLNGNAVGGETRVNATTTSNQKQSSVTGLPDGSWVVTWTSSGQDGNSSGIYQSRFITVTAFGTGKEAGTGTASDDLFASEAGGLSAGDSLEGGAGSDVIKLLEAGTLDLTAPDFLTGIDIVQGSSGNDIIIADVARLVGIFGIQGGLGTDELRLKAGSYDFTSKIISSIETITLEAASSITFLDKATALLVHSATNDGTVVLESDAFTGAERQQLYSQGIRHLTDANGMHVLQPVVPLLSAAKAQEGAATGTAVGDLTATDPNPGDGLSFSLVDSAGGRFKIVGNQIQVANGVLLDYEQAASHTIVVRATDAGGLVTDTSFTISLDDVAAETLTGTSASEVLKGGAGKDAFSGAGGDDRLWGGLGHDTLAGGTGRDAFVFDTKPSRSANRDTIGDFSVKDDSLWLDNTIFTKLGKAGSVTKPALLNKGYFALDKAKDGNDYLIYNRNTGVLSYDADGSGAKKAVEIALLKKGLALTYKDFFVI